MPLKRIQVSAQVVSPPQHFQPVTVRELSATLDEAWAPNYQATLTAPYSSALAAIDPRSAEVIIEVTTVEEYGRAMTLGELTASYTGHMATLTGHWGGDTLEAITDAIWFTFETGAPGYLPETVRTQIAALRGSSIDYAGQAITLTLAGLESLLQDDALISATDYTPPESRLIDIIDATLRRIGRELFEYGNGLQDVTIDAAQRVWKRGQSAFDYLYALTRPRGLLLYTRFDGRFALRTAYTIGEDIPSLNLNPGNNLISAEERRSRDENYYTAAIITYRWADSSGAVREAIDTWDTGAFPRRVYQDTVEGVYPGAGAARTTLETLQTRGRLIEAEAVAEYRATWLNNVAAINTETVAFTGRLQRVSWQHPADRMQITLRVGA